MYQETYYVGYLAICSALILWLGRLLHCAGRTLLEDAFGGNRALLKAISQLLDVGFYLMGFGYVAAWTANYDDFHNFGEVTKMVCGKFGGLLLLLGAVHLFNLLLLAIFRRRTLVANPSTSNLTPNSL